MGTKFSDYQNKTALITGASSGIGRALALDLAERGADLVLCARGKAELEALKTEIEAKGRKAEIVVLDLSKPDAPQKLFDQVQKSGASIDLLINNAGFGRWGAFDSFEAEDYRQMIDLNVTSLTLLCQLFLPQLIAKPEAGIINVGSTASFVPVPYSAVYGATKGYVLPFTEALHYEYEPKGVRIMALCPGATRTNFMQTALEKSESLTKRFETDGKSFMDSAQTAEEVSKECLDAFLKDKTVCISGAPNRRLTLLIKFLPRSAVLRAAGGRFKKMVG